MPKDFHEANTFAASKLSHFIVPALVCFLGAARPHTPALLTPTPVASGAAWAQAPMPSDEFWQRGFQDGMLGALSDLQDNRQPDPADRNDFRHPQVPTGMQDPYRQGFRRGYDAVVSKFASSDFRSWTRGPRRLYRRDGFRDGVTGAIKDFADHRRPDPANRDEYRHPAVPDAALAPYRDGFRYGYHWATSQLMDENHGR